MNEASRGGAETQRVSGFGVWEGLQTVGVVVEIWRAEV